LHCAYLIQPGVLAAEPFRGVVGVGEIFGWFIRPRRPHERVGERIIYVVEVRRYCCEVDAGVCRAGAARAAGDVDGLAVIKDRRARQWLFGGAGRAFSAAVAAASRSFIVHGDERGAFG